MPASRSKKKDAAERLADILMNQNAGLSTEQRKTRLEGLKSIAKAIRVRRAKAAAVQGA